MKPQHSRLTMFLIVIQAIGVLVLIYTFIIKDMFSSIDTLSENLANANVYNHLAAMIKQEIFAHVPTDKNNNVLTRAIVIGVVNTAVTPQLIQQFSKPLLTFGINWIAKPATISNNNIVIDTTQYKQQLKQVAAEKDLPQFLAPVGQQLENAIPQEIVIMDLNKHPHGIIPALVRGKIFYQHITLLNTTALWTVIVSLVALIFVNVHSLKRFFKALSVGYVIVGVVMLILSFLIPYVILPLFPMDNVDPAIRTEFNAMINDMAAYLFVATRAPSLYLIIGSGILYMVYRWSFIEKLQKNIDTALAGRASPEVVTKPPKRHHVGRAKTATALHKSH